MLKIRFIHNVKTSLSAKYCLFDSISFEQFQTYKHLLGFGAEEKKNCPKYGQLLLRHVIQSINYHNTVQIRMDADAAPFP
jgi:hypothetical protein